MSTRIQLNPHNFITSAPFPKLWDLLYTQPQSHPPCLKSGYTQRKPRKFSCKFPIIIENEGEFQVSRRIIGAKGCNMKKIIDLSLNEHRFESMDSFKEAKLIKLRLRGKGSGFMEGRKNSESKEALHLCISARSQELLSIACKHTEDLLKSIYQEFEVFCFERGLEPPNLQIRKVNVRTFQ